MPPRRWTLVAVALWASVVMVLPAAADEPCDTAALRPLQPWIRHVLDTAVARAPTVARLARTLCGASVIIHIDEYPEDGQAWAGRIRFVAMAGGYRYLRIELRALAPDVAAAMLAHELQHASEIVAGDVQSTGELAPLFRRIGFPHVESSDHFETEAAVEAGLDALWELTGIRGRVGPKTAHAIRASRAGRHTVAAIRPVARPHGASVGLFVTQPVVTGVVAPVESRR